MLPTKILCLEGIVDRLTSAKLLKANNKHSNRLPATIPDIYDDVALHQK
jgi:hypothetical protein